MSLTDNECINLRSALYDCFSNQDDWNNFFKDDKLNLKIDISNYPKKEDLDKIKSQYTEIKILIFEAPDLKLSLNQEYESIISSIKSSSHGNSFTIVRERVVKAHFGEEAFNQAETDIYQLIGDFIEEGDRATDQLLNIIYLLTNHITPEALEKDGLKKLLFKSLSISDEL